MMKIKILLIIVFALFLLRCGFDITEPTQGDRPSNVNVEKIDDGKVNISWFYDLSNQTIEEDSLYYKIGRKVGVSGWNEGYDYVKSDETSYEDEIDTQSQQVYQYKIRLVKRKIVDDEVEYEDVTNYSDIAAYFSEQANPSDLIITQTEPNKIVIQWQDNAIGETGYILERRIGNSGWKKIKSFSENENYFEDVDFDLFDEISYRVYAIAGSNNNSDKISETIVSNLMAPDSLSLEIWNEFETKVKLTWQDNSNEEEAFVIDRKIGYNTEWDTAYTEVDANVTSFIDEVDYPAVTLSYKVRAKKDNNYSMYSNEETINIRLDKIGEVTTAGDARDIFFYEWYAYIADYYNGLTIVDCRHPNMPESYVFNQGITDRAYSVAVKEDFAYISIYGGFGGNSDFYMLDIQEINEGNISEVDTLYIAGYCQTNGIPYQIKTKNQFSYIADGEEGLSVIFSNGGIPTLVGNCTTNGSAHAVEIKDNHAYVANGIDGLAIVDISSPYSPTLELNEDLDGGSAENIEIYDNYAFIANGDNGLVIYDINSKYYQKNIYIDGFVKDLKISYPYVYILDSEQGLLILDITDLNNPYILGVYEMTTNPKAIDISQSYAYITDNEGLKVIQIDE